MPDADTMVAAFERLAALFAPYREHRVVKAVKPRHLCLDAPPSESYPNGSFFGAVRTGRRSVSFQLMPVYVYPELLGDMSPGLRQRMQGKSCFNFTAPDHALLAELGMLTKADFTRYERDGLLSNTVS